MKTCTRCGVLKLDSDFWFNKSRNRLDTPCKECRNQQKKIRRISNIENSILSESIIKNAYRVKGLPTSFIEAYKQFLLLSRKLKESKDIKITQIENMLVIMCPVCGEFECIQTKTNLIQFKRFLDLTNEFQKRHEKCSE